MPSILDGSRPATVPVRLPVAHLSVSSLQRFWRCPEDWRRHYILGHRDPATGAMALGGAVGAAIAHHFSARRDGTRLTATHARDSFQHAFDLAARDARFEGADDAERTAHAAALRGRGEAVLAAYLRSSLVAELEREEVIAVEACHELAFPGAECSVVCYLDVVTAAGTIVDVKVKAKHLSDAEARRDIQARAYVLARRLAAANDGDTAPSRHFVFHSLRHGDKPDARAVPESGLVFGDRELDAFQRRLVVTARRIAECHRTGDWGYATALGWWCSDRCTHWTDCPGGSGD